MKKYNYAFSIFLICFLLSGCGSNEPSGKSDCSIETQNHVSDESATATTNAPSSEKINDVNTDTETEVAIHQTEASLSKGSRDNTPVILTPEASGVTVYSCNSAIIDASNASLGYIMANYTGTNNKVKLQITGTNGVTYTYNLHGGYEVFPLTAGDGDYTLGIYENISGTNYAMVLSTVVHVTMDNPFSPYLYPNQYVNFDASSLPVEKAKELAYSASDDLHVVESVYNYMIEHFTYDYDKANSVVSGYLPVINDAFTSNTGICFDYAAVMATMLRTQHIPTRLEVGYMGEAYHAWISTYIEDVGWVNGIIEFNGSEWTLLDPTFASTSESPKDFITENSKYLTKYVY